MEQQPGTPRRDAYADAGVDIAAGNALVEAIRPLAKSTARVGSNPDLGGFGGLFDLAACGFRDPVLVSATDGVGTKMLLGIAHDRIDGLGIDLVAMSVNDLVVQGATPLFFLDYLATSRLDIERARLLIAGIAEGCREAGCALVGGETAEMPDVYRPGDFDLAGFAVGAVERDGILPRPVRPGDRLLGLVSSGVHSNGFSLVRKLVARHGEPEGIDLLAPTRIYVKTLLDLFKAVPVHALAHITGGGVIDNLPRILPAGTAADIHVGSCPVPPIFELIQSEGGISQADMFQTFNMGMGMLAVLSSDALEKAHEALPHAYLVGEIVAGAGKVRLAA